MNSFNSSWWIESLWCWIYFKKRCCGFPFGVCFLHPSVSEVESDIVVSLCPSVDGTRPLHNFSCVPWTHLIFSTNMNWYEVCHLDPFRKVVHFYKFQLSPNFRRLFFDVPKFECGQSKSLNIGAAPLQLSPSGGNPWLHCSQTFLVCMSGLGCV